MRRGYVEELNEFPSITLFTYWSCFPVCMAQKNLVDQCNKSVGSLKQCCGQKAVHFHASKHAPMCLCSITHIFNMQMVLCVAEGISKAPAIMWEVLRTGTSTHKKQL